MHEQVLFFPRQTDRLIPSDRKQELKECEDLKKKETSDNERRPKKVRKIMKTFFWRPDHALQTFALSEKLDLRETVAQNLRTYTQERDIILYFSSSIR